MLTSNIKSCERKVLFFSNVPAHDWLFNKDMSSLHFPSLHCSSTCFTFNKSGPHEGIGEVEVIKEYVVSLHNAKHPRKKGKGKT